MKEKDYPFVLNTKNEIINLKQKTIFHFSQNPDFTSTNKIKIVFCEKDSDTYFYLNIDSERIKLYIEEDCDVIVENFNYSELFFNSIVVSKKITVKFIHCEIEKIDIRNFNQLSIEDSKIQHIFHQCYSNLNIDDKSKFEVRTIDPEPFDDEIFDYPSYEFQRRNRYDRVHTKMALIEWFLKENWWLRKKCFEHLTIQENNQISQNFYEKLLILNKIYSLLYSHDSSSFGRSFFHRYDLDMSFELETLNVPEVKSNWIKFIEHIKLNDIVPESTKSRLVYPADYRCISRKDNDFVEYEIHRFFLFNYFLYHHFLEKDDEIDKKFNLETIFEPIPFKLK
jgi:hypothetical protein